MSRPGVDESSERDFIKMILTKDQGRSVIVQEYGHTLGLGLVDRDRTIVNY